jgi:hypothetical protein
MSNLLPKLSAEFQAHYGTPPEFVVRADRREELLTGNREMF